MIKLTNLDGDPIWIGKTWIQLVRLPFNNEYSGTSPAGAVIVLSGVQQAVVESVDRAMEVINGDTR